MKTSTHKSINPGTIFLVVLTIAILTIAVTFLIESWQRTTIPIAVQMDLKKVDDYPLYVMHYQGDYAFDEFLKTGSREGTGTTTRISGNADWSCSVFAALSPSGDPLLGRNFDWNDDP